MNIVLNTKLTLLTSLTYPNTSNEFQMQLNLLQTVDFSATKDEDLQFAINQLINKLAIEYAISPALIEGMLNNYVQLMNYSYTTDKEEEKFIINHLLKSLRSKFESLHFDGSKQDQNNIAILSLLDVERVQLNIKNYLEAQDFYKNKAALQALVTNRRLLPEHELTESYLVANRNWLEPTFRYSAAVCFVLLIVTMCLSPLILAMSFAPPILASIMLFAMLMAAVSVLFGFILLAAEGKVQSDTLKHNIKIDEIIQSYDNELAAMPAKACENLNMSMIEDVTETNELDFDKLLAQTGEECPKVEDLAASLQQADAKQLGHAKNQFTLFAYHNPDVDYDFDAVIQAKNSLQH